MHETKGDYFQIRLDIICHEDGGKDDINCRDQIAKFLSLEGRWMNSAELYEQFHPNLYSHLPCPSNEEYALEYKVRDMKTLGNNKYYFGDLIQGVRLDQNIELDFHRDDHHREFFYYFFAYRISKINPADFRHFINFHFQLSFDNNFNEYQWFLTQIMGDYETLVQKRENLINLWITENQNKVRTDANDFGALLTDDGRKLLKYLMQEFTNIKKPQVISAMVLALIDLKLLPKSSLSNKAALYRKLNASFGKIGSEQAYNFSVAMENMEIQSKKEELVYIFKGILADIR